MIQTVDSGDPCGAPTTSVGSVEASLKNLLDQLDLVKVALDEVFADASDPVQARKNILQELVRDAKIAECSKMHGETDQILYLMSAMGFEALADLIRGEPKPNNSSTVTVKEGDLEV